MSQPRLALTTDLAIDLGTMNTVVAVPARDRAGRAVGHRDPSRGLGQRGASGRSRDQDMLGETPAAIKAVGVREGVISDIDVTEE